MVATRKYLSLREVGRQLGVPASTIVFYRDKFSDYIPSEGGHGRRRRYPAEAVEVFGRIRQMYGNNWSTEQIANELALKFGALLGQSVEDVQTFSGEGLSSRGAEMLSAVLDRVSDVLQNQDLFRGEIRSLRDEMVSLRRERGEGEKRTSDRITELERQMDVLRSENERLRRMMRHTGGENAPQFPSAGFLSRPLVVRTEAGEFLGVNGKDGGHFALKDFVSILERRAAEHPELSLRWEVQEDRWVLVVEGGDEDAARRIVLVTRKTLTPNRNVVTEILRMNVNGQDAPDVLMLSLFKQIRDGFGL